MNWSKLLAYLGLSILSLGYCQSGQAQPHAVAMVYHHVASDTPASTSVSPSQFAAHVDYLQAQQFNVWHLGQIVRTLQAGQALPERTIALTFDDAYQSVYSTVLPMLQARGWPMTVFVNTAATERGQAPYMSWQQLRKLVAAGVEIGNHSHSHAHLLARLPGESKADWRARVTSDIQRAQHKLQQQLGVNATLFAYPYGEFSQPLQALVAEQKLLGVAQHSGAFDAHSDFLALPRFPMSGIYASTSNFIQRANTAPLHLSAVPANGHIVRTDTPLALQLTLQQPPANAHLLACFSSLLEPGSLQQQAVGRWSLQLSAAAPVGRSKINCTLPDLNRPGQYLWWSYLLMRPPADAAWYTQ